MNLSSTIRKISSALLIGVFALSITPVIVLHKIAANHKDISYANKQQKGDQYSKAGINCNCINFVAEAPFINTFSPINFTFPKSVSSFTNYYRETFYSQHHFYAALRGPPVAA
ncbi:MAG: hypothetical protein ABJA37_15585 [Ferruginibacter sp.]